MPLLPPALPCPQGSGKGFGTPVAGYLPNSRTVPVVHNCMQPQKGPRHTRPGSCVPHPTPTTVCTRRMSFPSLGCNWPPPPHALSPSCHRPSWQNGDGESFGLDAAGTDLRLSLPLNPMPYCSNVNRLYVPDDYST